MNIPTTQFITWLLVLIMVINPVQVTMAADTDQNSQGVNCQMSFIPMSDTSPGNHCPMLHDEKCQQHTGCVVQLTVTALPLLHSLLLTQRPISSLKFIIEKDAFNTQYPSLLKRPPRSRFQVGPPGSLV